MLYLQEYDPIKAGSIDGLNGEFHDAAVKRATTATCKIHNKHTRFLPY
jgi:hypothetical protein